MSVCKNSTTGNWEAWYYVRDNGNLKKRCKKGFKTKSEAQQYELAHRHEDANIKDLTFEVVFETMSRANRASSNTTNTRRQRLKDYADEIYYEKMSDVSKSRLISWREHLDKYKLSTATKNDIIGYVKQVFKYGYDVYDLYDAGKVLKTFPKTLDDMSEMHIVNYAQFQNMISCEHDETLRTFFLFLFMTGCRKGEARALLKTDFDGTTVRIYKSMRRYESSLTTTKTRNQRTVYLDKYTSDKLTMLLETPGPYLFGGETPISLTKIEQHFKKNLKSANLPDMRIHDLRHSNVSMLWAAGVPIPEISKRIGHSSPKITMETYAHIFDNKQNASVDFLNRLVTL